MVSHVRELADHDLEHLVAEAWASDRRAAVPLGELRKATRVEDLDGAVGRLVERGLATVDGSTLALTAEGRAQGEELVRRHRLAEMLFSTVLDVRDDRAVDRTACVMEHVLSPTVTDSVCSFLGHPKRCPHGKPIPAGRCCRSFSNAVEPLVQPLARLPVGRSAKIVYIVPRDAERLVRLADLGLVPGASLRLTQRRPAIVVGVGEATLALDPEIGSEIYVKSES